MEITYRFQEEFDLYALTSKLSNEIDELALNLEAAAQGGPPICVDLYRILNQCSEIDPLRRKVKDKLERTACVDRHLERNYSRALAMICCGYCFRSLIHGLGGHPNSTWDIKLASIDRRRLRVHARFCEEDDRLERHKKHVIEGYLERMAQGLSSLFPTEVDLALMVTDQKAQKSYHVLGLFRSWSDSLSFAEALAGTDGALYVRGDVESVWGETAKYSSESTFIRYKHVFSTCMRTLTSFSDSTGEPQVKGERVIGGREQWNHLPNTTPDFSAFAGAAALIPLAVMRSNEGKGTPARFQVPSAYTQIDVVNQQVSIVDHAGFASGPNGEFPAPKQFIDVYGFTQITPSTPVNAVAQGLLPYESGDWEAPVSVTSPEADSPWSERDGPPPPYVLSPGSYHLRLEAATRPSPTSR